MAHLYHETEEQAGRGLGDPAMGAWQGRGQRGPLSGLGGCCWPPGGGPWYWVSSRGSETTQGTHEGAGGGRCSPGWWACPRVACWSPSARCSLCVGPEGGHGPPTLAQRTPVLHCCLSGDPAGLLKMGSHETEQG